MALTPAPTPDLRPIFCFAARIVPESQSRNEFQRTVDYIHTVTEKPPRRLS